MIKHFLRRSLLRSGLAFEDPDQESAFVEHYVARHLTFMRFMALAGAILTYVFVVWDRIIDLRHAGTTEAIRGLILAPCALLGGALSYIPKLRRYAEIVFLSSVVAVGCGISLIFGILHRGFDFGVAGLALADMFLVAVFPMRFKYAAAGLATMSAAFLVVQYASGEYSPAMPVVNLLFVVSFGMSGITAVGWRERSARSEYLTTISLEASRARVDELLYSMLPAEIVKRIQSGEALIADAYGEVSIVFIDLVGFTDISRRVTAVQLVEMLNHLFSQFDQRSSELGLERIKTIGDAYMAVGGLKGSRSGDHAGWAADFALAAREIVRQLSSELLPINIRVGLHVGPVVAGVIGTRRPAFDCWGETVNLASRLETSAEPGSIYISESAYHRLKDLFRVRVLEAIDLKGIGSTKVYILEERVRVAGPKLVKFPAQMSGLGA